MSGAYDNRYEFPVRMMNEEILEVLRDKRPEDIAPSEMVDLETIKRALAEHQRPTDRNEPFDPNDHVTWLEFYETRGDVEELEKVLKKHQIPFDRHCTAAEGNSPDMFYYRPELGIERRVEVNHDGDEVLTISRLKGMLQSNDIKKEIETFIHQNSSTSLPPIYDYTSETKLGRDKDTMSKIDQVLAKLDAGEINDAEAMQQIALIREAQNG